MFSRRRYLAVAAATVLAGCGSGSDDASRPPATTAASEVGPGPGYGGVETETERETTSSPAEEPSGEAVAWSVPVGAPVTADPVVAGDTIVLGSGQHDAAARPDARGELAPARASYLHGVDLDGTPRSRYVAPAPVLSVGARREAATSPAGIGPGAYAILGWYGGPGGVDHRLVRVERGQPRWFGPRADANRFVAAVPADGVVTGTRDERVASTGERLRSRDRSGAWRWGVESGDVLAGTAADGRVFLTVGTGETRCLGARSGETLWAYAGRPPTWTPRVQDGVVLVARGSRTGLGGNPLVALDAVTGERQWTFPGRGDVAFTPVATERVVPDGTADAVVYVAGTVGDLWAVDETGRELFRVQLGGRVVRGPVVADGHVYATDTAGMLYAIDAATGERAWTRDGSLPARALDATADRGVVLVAASAGAPGGDSYRVREFDHQGRVRFDHGGSGGLLAAFAHDGRGYAVTESGHLAGFGPGTT